MQMDLFHYTGAGTRGLNKGPGRSFSIDNGTTLLKAFNDFNANMGDLQDWADGTNDSFNAFSTDGVLNDLSEVDLRVMDVIGYDRGTVATSGSAANISTRLPVGTGDNLLITGFIIQGPAGSTKKVLVRGIGPSIPLNGVLADPTLELRDSGGALLASNDNWRTTQIGGLITADQVAEIQAANLAPTNDAESTHSDAGSRQLHRADSRSEQYDRHRRCPGLRSQPDLPPNWPTSAREALSRPAIIS